MKHTFFALVFFLFSAAGSAQAVGGIYFPATVSSTPLINPIAQNATFIKVDSVVIVYGTIFLNGFPTVDKYVTIQITPPFPTNMAGSSFPLFGQATVLQNGLPVVGVVQQNGNNFTIRYKPSVSFPANLYYNYSYLIRP